MADLKGPFLQMLLTSKSLLVIKFEQKGEKIICENKSKSKKSKKVIVFSNTYIHIFLLNNVLKQIIVLILTVHNKSK